jgi:hypothetical protein
MYKLKKKGFYVDYAPPNRIYISWDRALTKALKNSDREWHNIATEKSKMSSITDAGPNTSIEDVKKEFMNEDAARTSCSSGTAITKRWDYELIQKKNMEESKRTARVLRRGCSTPRTSSVTPVEIPTSPQTPLRTKREIERDMQKDREQMKIEEIIKRRDQNAMYSQNFTEKKNNKKFLQITT